MSKTAKRKLAKPRKTTGTMHQPMPVAGYTAQNPRAIELANRCKQLEEQVLRLLDDLEVLARTPTPIMEATGMGVHTNGRDVALARTYIENGFMRAVRSIFKPQRLKLPHDL